MINTIRTLATDKHQLLILASGLIFSIFTILAIRYQINLLDYIEWGDESETIVTAKMIAAGSSLYSEIFNHHGPLTFLPGVIIEKLGDFGVSAHRIPIAILQATALAAIYVSPLLRDKLERRIYTILAATVMLVYLPGLLGHMYTYQTMSGLLLVIILAKYTLPAIAAPEKLTTKEIIIGNILIGSLPFLAISYAPISALLFIASLRKQFFIKSIAWLTAGAGLNTLFLAYIGSIPGYLAFHIHMNIDILPLYTGGQGALSLIKNSFVGFTENAALFIAIMTAFAILALNEPRFPWRSAMLGIGIGSLLIRGADFHGLPYFYASLAMPLVFFKNQPRMNYQSSLIAFILITICLIKLSLTLPEDRKKIDGGKIPESTEFSQLAKTLTLKKDLIIAYSFQNFQYIAADRLPASGYFFYLPWQEKYNENPKFDIKIDACQDIDQYRPKIMLIDKWTVWGSFPWDSYAGCIQKIIDKDYYQIPGRPYYVRKDLLPADPGIAAPQEPYKIQPSSKLDAHTPIKIRMPPSHQDDQMAIKRVGVRFGTHAKENPGLAELHLKGPGGSEFVQRFSLSDLPDNKYRYFDLDSRRYTEGEIIFITGGGVSTWESQDKEGNTNTCIIYHYDNDKVRFTPGCPFE